MSANLAVAVRLFLVDCLGKFSIQAPANWFLCELEVQLPLVCFN